MGYELRSNAIEPVRNTFSYLEERFGDRQATRYQEASFNVQPTENFHYRPTWDADRELYDPDYTVLKLADPYSYTDPRQYYYTPYVAAAAARHESFAQTLKYVEDRRLLDKLPDSFQITLRGFVIPLRHYESGAQLISLNGSRFAWGTTVEQPIAFAAMDRMGNAQQLSLVGLAMAGGAGDTLAEAKKNWLFSGPLQGIRKAMEQLLVEGDWAVGVIGLDLIDELLHPVVFEHLDDRALARGAVAYSQLARHFGDWYRNHRKFMASLLKAWATDPEHGESNREAMGDIVGRWFPIVHSAVAEYAVGIAEAAGSTTAVAAVERSSAELANQLKKLGVHVRAVQEAAR
jgi:phenol hydroxylase P1 protein